jgi:hypothetical protein
MSENLREGKFSGKSSFNQNSRLGRRKLGSPRIYTHLGVAA